MKLKLLGLEGGRDTLGFKLLTLVTEVVGNVIAGGGGGGNTGHSYLVLDKLNKSKELLDFC